MFSLLTLSLLLAAVYQWEELKRAVRIVAYGIVRAERKADYYARHYDELVGGALLAMTVPFSMTYLLTTTGSLEKRLLSLAAQLLIIATAAAISSMVVRWQLIRKRHEAGERWAPLALYLAGAAAPILHFFNPGVLYRHAAIARLAIALSIGPLTGLVCVYLLGYAPQNGQYLPNLHALIGVLVGALIVRIAIDALEKAFRPMPARKFSLYLRVTLGLALIGILSAGLY